MGQLRNIFDEHAPPPPEEPSTTVIERGKKRPSNIELLTTSQFKRGMRRLSDLTEMAFDLLEQAMVYADYPTAVVAAKLVLDRTGYGPQSTLKIEEGPDLSQLSDEELYERSKKIMEMIRPRVKNPEMTESTESTPSSNSVH